MILNVRLSPTEARIVKGLRRRKVNVSALVRRGIADAGARMLKAGSTTPAEDILDILREVPGPAASGRPPLDDRRRVRAFIQKKLRRG